MRIPIVTKSVNEQSAVEVDVRIVGYQPGSGSLTIYYGYFNSSGLLIPTAEGNLTITNSYLDSTVDTALQNALQAQVGTVSSWTLAFHPLYGKCYFEYVQSGVTNNIRIATSPISNNVYGNITETVFSILLLQGTTSAAQRITGRYADIIGATDDVRSALLTLTQALENADLYMRLYALYLFLGSTLASKMLNMLDPSDEDEAFRLTATTGTPTDHTNGLLLANSHAVVLDSHIFMTSVGNQPFIGAGTYLQNAPGSVIYGDPSSYFTHTYYDTGKAYGNIGAISSGISISSGLKGHWNVQRIDIDNVEVRNEGSLIGTDPTHSLGLQGDTIKLAVGYAGIDAIISMMYVHGALTSTQQTALNTAIQNFMTALNRHV